MTDYPFADLALARRLERTEAAGNAGYVEARASVAPAVGAAWIEVGGTYAMFDGVDSPLTQTFGLGLFSDVTDDQLDAIEQFYRERQAPVFHEVCPMADAGTLARLSGRKYEPFELTSVLYRPVTRTQASIAVPSSSIRVRIAGAAEHDLWAATAAAGWSDSPELAAFMRDIGQVTAARRDIVLFLAEEDGQPIGAAALSLCDDVALLAGASTIPASRGRGAQLALLDARLHAAQNRRCSLAMMAALPGSGSQRNAERNGFRIAYTRIKWRQRRPPDNTEATEHTEPRSR